MRPIGVFYGVVSHGKFDDEGEDKKGNEVNNKEVTASREKNPQ